MKIARWLVIPLCAGALTSRAENAPAAVVKTRPTAVALFKNGIGFVTREGEAPKGESAVLVDELPVPVHGTFWIESPDADVKLDNVVAFETDAIKKFDAISVAEIIEANVGATVEVRVGEKESVRGKILSVAGNRPPEIPAGTLRGYQPPFESATLVLIQTETGVVALNRNAIQQVTVLDAPVKTSFERKQRVANLRLRSVSPRGQGRLRLTYLTKGITWAPSYAVDLAGPTTARFTAKAEIINEAEDLDHVPVSFITGFPNLQFADVTDPIAVRGDLASFLSSLLNPPTPGVRGGRRAAVMQQAMSNVAWGGEEEAGFANIPLEGQTREELFFYEQKDVSLKKGERGYYPMFHLDVPYEHVYEWKIADTLTADERYRSSDPNETEKPEEVWHSVRLTNTGKVPWTTAPAMTLQGGQILGQDLLSYAGVGVPTTVRITQAVDVKAEQAEFEVDRKRNAAHFYGSNYDQVEVRGQLKVTNWKAKDITLHIAKSLSGEVIKTAPEAKVEQLAKALRRVNPNAVLTWELPIKSKEKLEIDYTYKVYVRD